MSEKRLDEDDVILDEADFERAVANPYPEIARQRGFRVLDEDLRRAFPDSASVNQALRILLKAGKEATEKVELPKAS